MYGLNKKVYKQGDFYGNSTDRSPEYGETIYNKVSLTLNEVVRKVTVETFDPSRSKLFPPLDFKKIEEQENSTTLTCFLSLC